MNYAPLSYPDRFRVVEYTVAFEVEGAEIPPGRIKAPNISEAYWCVIARYLRGLPKGTGGKIYFFRDVNQEPIWFEFSL